jgi:hypothetical protein
MSECQRVERVWVAAGRAFQEVVCKEMKGRYGKTKMQMRMEYANAECESGGFGLPQAKRGGLDQRVGSDSGSGITRSTVRPGRESGPR